MVYNPALNQFLLVEGKKKDISYSYPTLFNKKKTNIPVWPVTQNKYQKHKYHLSIGEELRGIPLVKSCQTCVCVCKLNL